MTAILTAAEMRLAVSLLPDDDAGSVAWNASVMELGALICTAATPKCTECPVRPLCAWDRAGRPLATAGGPGTRPRSSMAPTIVLDEQGKPWAALGSPGGSRIITIVLDEITGALARGDRVELRGFGAFTVKHRAARQGRNPRTGDTVFVEDKFVPFFKTGKELRERLNREDGAA